MIRDKTRIPLSIEGRMIGSSPPCSADDRGTSLSCFILSELMARDRVRVDFSC